MVYDSDFYTTRRYRPTTSTYSVTPYSSIYTPFYSSIYYVPPVSTVKLSQADLIWRGGRSPSVTRLVVSPSAPHHLMRVRVRPAVVLRELDRIQHKYRVPYIGSAPFLSSYYDSPATRAFEDESRRIRADAASALARARSVVPRAKTVLPLDTIHTYTYGEPLPYRFSNDAYVARLLYPLRSVYDNVRIGSYYENPAPRFTGRGKLACVHYSGGKAFPNRRPLYKELSVRDDVNLLSFYAKNRLAACGLASDDAAAPAAAAAESA